MSARRLPIVLVLLAAVVAAVVAGEGAGRTSPPAAPVRDPLATPAASTSSSAWFCPGPPASVAPERQALSIANAGEEPTEVIVTAYPDDGSAPVVTPVEVAAGSLFAQRRTSFGPAGAITVEASSPDVVVGLDVDREGLARQACATAASDTWHFAAGTTVRGVEQWLTLFNPLGADAKVAITLRTDEGIRRPPELGSIDVPRRTRLVVPIHESAVRTGRVALEIHATVGRVVAENTLVFGEASGFTGLTGSIGTSAPASQWTFPTSQAGTGASPMLAVVNPNVVAAEVDVAVTGPELQVQPVTVTVPGDGITWIRFDRCDAEQPVPECIPVGGEAAFAVALTSDANTPVVAEQLGYFRDAPVGSGVTATLGLATAATTWRVPYVAAGRSATAVLSVANPGATPAAVDVTLLGREGATRPEELQGVVVAPGQTTAVDLSELVERAHAVVVTADTAVVVETSTYSAGEVSRSPAVRVPD